MNMRQGLIFLFTIALFLTDISFLAAQSQDLQKGNRLFENKEYALATNFFENFLKNSDDVSIKRKLATCYLETKKDNEASFLLENIVNLPIALPEDYLKYANLLKKTHNYEQALIWFQKYAELKPEDKSISNLIISCNLIKELQDNQLFFIKSIGINSSQSDFASSFYKRGLIFVSGRKNNNSREIDGQTGEHFLDLYFTEKNGDNYSPPIPFSEELNSKYHEGPACFTSNEKFIFFTRNKGTLNLEGKSELNIYTARNNGKTWDKPELFQFSDLDFSMGHPSISSDGRQLFFISNMDGGYGGTDIYTCKKQGFFWSQPINLGPTINTSGNEMFPFIADDGFLYFASDGHIGFGGLDLFKSIFEHNEWSYPVNLGPPFNSSKDDFGYLIKTSKELGYFSSNRNGNDDIFEFSPNPEKVQNLKGRIILNDKKSPLADVEVTLMENLSKENLTKTDANGFFNFPIFKGINYSLIVSKPGYKIKRILYFAQESKTTPNQLNIMMEKTPWKALKGNVIDQYSGRAITDATIDVINQSYQINTICLSDKNGDFEQLIDPSKSYNIIIQKEGYFTKVINNYQYLSDKYEQVELQKFSKNQLMELFGVEFENGSWKLTENTLIELDNLVGLLQVNPNITIEINGYTNQDKGKKENGILGASRAEESANYIISKGITPNRVLFKSGGYNPNKSALVVKLIEAF